MMCEVSDKDNTECMTVAEHRALTFGGCGYPNLGRFMKINFLESYKQFPVADRIASVSEFLQVSTMEGTFECQKGLQLHYVNSDGSLGAEIANHVSLLIIGLEPDRVAFSRFPNTLYDALNYGVVAVSELNGVKRHPVCLDMVNGDWQSDKDGEYDVWMDEHGVVYLVLTSMHNTFFERMCLE